MDAVNNIVSKSKNIEYTSPIGIKSIWTYVGSTVTCTINDIKTSYDKDSDQIPELVKNKQSLIELLAKIKETDNYVEPADILTLNFKKIDDQNNDISLPVGVSSRDPRLKLLASKQKNKDIEVQKTETTINIENIDSVSGTSREDGELKDDIATIPFKIDKKRSRPDDTVDVVDTTNPSLKQLLNNYKQCSHKSTVPTKVKNNVERQIQSYQRNDDQRQSYQRNDDQGQIQSYQRNDDQRQSYQRNDDQQNNLKKRRTNNDFIIESESSLKVKDYKKYYPQAFLISDLYATCRFCSKLFKNHSNHQLSKCHHICTNAKCVHNRLHTHEECEFKPSYDGFDVDAIKYDMPTFMFKKFKPPSKFNKF